MRLLKYSFLILFLFVYACANTQNKDTPVFVPEQPKVAEEVTPSVVPVTQNETISFAENSTVYFDFDVINPKKEELFKLENQAKWLSSHNFKQIIIEGHTDIIGTREYNLALGERRANFVKSILVKYNVDPSKVKVVSYGKERLADSNIHSKNRRTVTKVVN